MNDGATPGVIDPTGGEAWWFLGTLAIIRIDGAQTAGRFAIMEFLLPKDASPPVHAHPQDETFMLLDGQMTIWIAGQPRRCTPGSIAFAPGAVGHSFIVESDVARVLTLSTPSGIEEMVRGLGQRALERRIPDDDEAPYPPTQKIEAVFAACGIMQLGPSPRQGKPPRLERERRS